MLRNCYAITTDGTDRYHFEPLAPSASGCNDLEFLLQSLPVEDVLPPRCKRRHRSKYQQQKEPSPEPTLPIDLCDYEIPRLPMEINFHPGKMLALPIPTVRPVDLNDYREPGHVGINPITMMGEHGLLPGKWGEGKELLSTSLRHRSADGKQTLRLGAQVLSCRSMGSRGEQRSSLQIPEKGPMDLHELRMQYAQAVLDGAALSESSCDDTPPLSLTMHCHGTPLRAGCQAASDDSDDWEDVSDDDDNSTNEDKAAMVFGEKASDHQRKDSGYSSSSETDSVGKTGEEESSTWVVWQQQM